MTTSPCSKAARRKTSEQLDELRSLRGKNADVIMHLMSKSREEQAAYLRNVESFQNSRRLLQNQARNMLDALSMDNLDRLINKTRDTMTHSWTTSGYETWHGNLLRWRARHHGTGQRPR